jgi:hypothetical protein
MGLAWGFAWSLSNRYLLIVCDTVDKTWSAMDDNKDCIPPNQTEYRV